MQKLHVAQKITEPRTSSSWRGNVRTEICAFHSCGIKFFVALAFKFRRHYIFHSKWNTWHKTKKKCFLARYMNIQINLECTEYLFFGSVAEPKKSSTCSVLFAISLRISFYFHNMRINSVLITKHKELSKWILKCWLSSFVYIMLQL